MGVEVIDVVKESEIVIDLQDDRRRGTCQGDQVDAFDPQACLWLEHGSCIGEERPDLHPCNNVVYDP